MAGRCFGCADEFGFFKREYDCANCGRIFCSKCLSNSIVIPNKGKKAVKVCNNCFQELSRKQQHPGQTCSSTSVISKRSQGTSTNQQVTTAIVEHDPDKEIQKRLQKLKEADDSSREREIQEKFQNLTGRAPVTARTTNINTFGPKKTEAEQMTDLLKQMQDECNLDERTSFKASSETTDEDIAKRLDKLKGREPRNQSDDQGAAQAYDYDSDDEAEFRKRYIKQAIAESFLDDKVRKDGHGDLLDKANQRIFSKEYQTVSDPDELPWCCICNEDAILCCHGCDGDLYCKRCFREGHTREDFEDHTTSPYQPARKR